MQFTRWLIRAISVLMLTGCVSVHTRADEFLVEFSSKRMYQTLVPLILMWEEPSDGVNRGRQALVVPPDANLPGVGRLYCGPPASNPWVSPALHGNCWAPEDVIAVVPAGTTLVVDHIERTRGWNVWYGRQDDLIPFANLIVNGLPTNAEISDASRKVTRTVHGRDIRVPVPDPEILREADSASPRD